MNINRMIKLGGTLYIHDVIFQFDFKDYTNRINQWINKFEKINAEGLKEDIETHIRDEYSTFDWILDEMLIKAGFSIKEKKSRDEFILEYNCIKVKEI